MSEISLQEQIEFMQSHIPTWEANSVIVETDKAILSSLKRLQAIEGQEVVAYRWFSSKWHVNELHSADDLPANAPYEKEQLYALPPDAQDMINKLTAKNAELWQRLQEQSSIYTGFLLGGHAQVCAERDALKAQRDALMLEYCPDEMSEEQIKEWGTNQAVSESELPANAPNDKQPLYALPPDAQGVIDKLTAELKKSDDCIELIKRERNVLQKIAARRANMLEQVGLHSDCTSEEADALRKQLAHGGGKPVSEREAFEAWVCTAPKLCTAWEVWQARAQLNQQSEAHANLIQEVQP